VSARSTPGQFWRYAAVGLVSNLTVYALYLLLTHWGLASKVAMTLTYAAGVAQTFVFNKHWSFRSGGRARAQFGRYLAVYAIGYALNLAGLFLLVDVLGWAHQLAQGILIVAIAVLLFLLQKFWVFRAPPRLCKIPLPTP
jgi:putative flippase GtrA